MNKEDLRFLNIASIAAIFDYNPHKVKKTIFLPEHGKVGILYITDKQFGEMQVFYGKKVDKPKPAAMQLELF